MRILRFHFVSVALLATAAACRVQASESADSSEFDQRPPVPGSVELSFGDLSWKTSGPFTGITKNFRANPIPYRMSVTTLSYAHRVPLRGLLWRNFEFVHSAVWSAITRGPENHWGGTVTGLRYTYDLPARFPVAVFVSWQGGVGGIDSSGQRYAQEKDLTFAYLNAIGLRTQVTRSIGLQVQLLGQHISNGWQTRPSEGIDCAGWSFAISFRPHIRR